MKQDTFAKVDQEILSKQDLIEIYEEYSPRLFRYAFRLLEDSHTAEDCVSETFSRFLQGIQRGVRPKDNLKGYLYRIAHNWIMDYFRHRVPADSPIDLADLVSSHPNPEAAFSSQTEKQKVREALLNLPESQQQIIMLRFFEEWSHEETAAALGKSVEATRALQYRALNSLRTMLIPEKA